MPRKRSSKESRKLLEERIRRAKTPGQKKHYRQVLKELRSKDRISREEYKSLMKSMGFFIGKTKPFRYPLYKMEKILQNHIKRHHLAERRKSGWLAEQEAYKNYIKPTVFSPLFEAFHKFGVREIERAKKTSRDTKPIENAFAWHTFHIQMKKAVKKYGSENIASLAKMFSKAEGAEIRIRSFRPESKAIILTVDLPVETELKPFLRERIAIEEMKNGKITKIGSPVKYILSDDFLKKHFESGEWFEKKGKTPQQTKRYEKIKKELNNLV